MKISIITVIYNDPIGLKKTIKSLSKQKLTSQDNLEYIIVDGGSGKKTIDIIYDNRNIISKFISEPDNGIYDAMNKAIKISSGDWVYFLNAGDIFASNNVLDSIATIINNNENINFIYGDYFSSGKIYKQNLSLTYLMSHMINHQSIFYKINLFKNCVFDTRYKFCADYDHLLKVYNYLKPYYIDKTISIYDDLGVSSLNRNKFHMWSERLTSIWKSTFSFHKKFYLSLRGIVALPYQFIKQWM